MYVHFGRKPFGKCDVMPGLFCVSTLFFHINFVPLVPLGSYLILGQNGKQYQAVKIPFSFKSLLYAWSRAFFLGAAVVAWILFFIALADNHIPRETELATPLVLAILCTAGFLFAMIYPRVRMPDYLRACQLAEYAGLNEQGWAALNVLHGKDPFDRPAKTEVLRAR